MSYVICKFYNKFMFAFPIKSLVNSYTCSQDRGVHIHHVGLIVTSWNLDVALDMTSPCY